MLSEQEKTLEALKTAIEMEKDGRECYLQASRTSTNEPAKKLLLTLADEEKSHQTQIEKIYNTIRAKKAWPTRALPAERVEALRALFAQTCEALGPDAKPISAELDILKMAIDKENKSFDYYREKSQTASYDGEREFYKALSVQENGHRLLLLDYQEFLTNPAGWFVMKERQSLDGG